MKITELDAEISSLLRAFEKTRDRVSAAAEATGGDPVDLSRLADLIDQRVEDLVTAREERLSAIEALPDPAQRQVLILRDVGGMRWAEVAREMNYTREHVQRIYRKARHSLYE